MADINQQTEELARIMEQVNREMAAYGQISKSTGDQKRDAEIEAATGMKNFTKGAAAGADAVGHLASAGMAAGKAMLEGKRGAAAFNESIDGLSKAATAAGIALTLMIPGGAIIKGIVAGFTALTAATAGMVKESNIMADKLHKSYSGLAQSGAAASDGMTGVFKDAKKLGLGMDQLDSMVNLVGENSKDLALFSGSVFEGRQKFAEMGAAMEPYRKQMMAAGYTQEQINESSMGYIKLQTRMGAAQNMTTTQLADGAKKYLSEQDALTKLTGQTRKEMEDQNAKALAQQQFASKIRELEMTGQKEAADELMKLNTMYGAMGPKTQAAFQASVTGNLANADALEINMQSQGEMMRTATAVAAGQMKAADAAQTTGTSIGKFNDEVNVSLGGLNASIGDFQEGEKARQLTAGKGLVENLKAIEEEQKKQGLKGGKAADSITDQYAENIVQQQKLNEKFEKTVFDGIDNALKITNRLGNVTDSLATGFEKLGKAVNKLLRIVGLGVEDTPEEKAKLETDKKQDQKNFESASFTEKIQSSLARGIEHAARGAGNLVGSKSLVGLADSAQQERVASESAYLKEKGKFQQVQPAGGQRALPAGTAPSSAGGGRGSVAPPSGGPPAAGGATTRSMAPSTGSPPPPSAGSPDGQPGQPTPAGQAQGGGKGSLKIGPNADMSGLDNEMMLRLQKFAESTGKSVEVNSAFRSDQKQAELWVRGHILNEPGVHMPAAPKDDQEVNYKGKTFQVKGSGKGSLHGVGNAVDISVAGMGKSKGPMDELLATAGLFRPFIANDHPHVQMMAEGGIVEPTPGGTPAIIGEGGNAEAVIPLKNGAVPVRLLDDKKDDPDTHTKMPDFGSMINSLSSTMFAAVQTLQPESISSKFDSELRQEVVEPVSADDDTATEVFETPMANEPTGLMEFIKEAKEANFAMLAMLSEMVREQRNTNDISTRILQVSSN
jgi:hypothetical protein